MGSPVAMSRSLARIWRTSARTRRGPQILEGWPSLQIWVFVAGPAIAGVLGTTAWGPVAPVTAAALISLAATLVIIFRLPESHPCVLTENPEQPNLRKVFGQEQRDCFDMRAEPLNVSAALKRPGLLAVLCMHLLVMLGFNFFYVAFPVYATQDLGWSLTETGTFFAVMGLLMAGVQGPVLQRVTGRWSEAALIAGGSMALAAGFWLYQSTGTALLYLAAVLMAVGNGLMWPSLQAALARIAGKTYQGAVQGLAGSLGAVASIAGLVVGGVLYASVGAGVFQLSTAIIVAVSVLSLALPRDERSGCLPSNHPRRVRRE